MTREEAYVFICSDLSPREVGRIAYTKKGCVNCHSLDGSPRKGPSFLGLWGKRETLLDGTELVVDAESIRTSILEPEARVAPGFDVVMPSYRRRIKDPEIDGLIALIRTLATEPSSPQEPE